VLLSCHIHYGVGKGQRISGKLFFKVRKTVAETLKMLCEAYSDDSLSEMMTYEWFKNFKNGRTSMDDNERAGQPSTSKSKPLIAQVKNIISGNRGLTA
jgi:hypothetical protein